MQSVRHFCDLSSRLCPLPSQVGRHLAKLFDSIAKLKFKMDPNDKPLKVGVGMYSKEDEYVDFDKDCDCSGQVGGFGAPWVCAQTPLAGRSGSLGPGILGAPTCVL